MAGQRASVHPVVALAALLACSGDRGWVGHRPYRIGGQGAQRLAEGDWRKKRKGPGHPVASEEAVEGSPNPPTVTQAAPKRGGPSASAWHTYTVRLTAISLKHRRTFSRINVIQDGPPWF